MKDGNESGILVLGNAATIDGDPLLNILASSQNYPAVCLQIIDCKEHMQEGGTKDAEFTMKEFEKEMNNYYCYYC